MGKMFVEIKSVGVSYTVDFTSFENMMFNSDHYCWGFNEDALFEVNEISSAEAAFPMVASIFKKRCRRLIVEIKGKDLHFNHRKRGKALRDSFLSIIHSSLVDREYFSKDCEAYKGMFREVRSEA